MSKMTLTVNNKETRRGGRSQAARDSGPTYSRGAKGCWPELFDGSDE